MAIDAKAPNNWFDQGGRAYAHFRPDYPQELASFLAEIAPSRNCVVDVGCGNGQLTARLAIHFDEVVGLDSSADQIANTLPRAGVRYICAPAEKLPLPDRSANLITAAQAAHWFDLPAFYAEARRIATDGAVLSLVSYGVLQLKGPLQERFSRFYDEIGPYWPPERRLVDDGYRDLSFPFEERQPPAMDIQRAWDLGDFLGYLSTWSAVQRVIDAGRDDILTVFVRDISELWGDLISKQPVSWPINMRIGQL